MRNINGKYSGDYLIVDANSGEVTAQGADFTVMSDEFRRILRNKPKSLNAEYTGDFKQFGNFFWGVYNLEAPYLQNLTGATVTRLIYLATYLSYDGCLIHDKSNSLPKDYINRPLTKEDMQHKLKLNKTAFASFFKEVTENDILQESNDAFYINKNYFTKGKISRKYFTGENDAYVTKIYADAIRTLYISATPRSHKTLSYIFRLIPHINRRYNIVCKNPLETNLDKLDKMTLGDFCEAVGYGRTHAKVMFDILFEPEFITRDGKTTSVIRYVVVKSASNKENFYMFVNPRIYFGGFEYSDVEILGVF